MNVAVVVPHLRDIEKNSMNKWLNWTPPIKEKDSLIIKEDRSDESPLYLGMSLSPCTKPHRLKLFWSILGECIEERKEFYFRCDNEEEADELKKLTYSMVFQINDIWEVSLDDLVVKARPPRSNALPNGNQTTKD